VNAGKTLNKGIEAMSRIRWLEGSMISSTASINYTYTHYKFREFIEEGNDFSGSYLPGIPQHKISIELDADLPYGSYIEANWLGVDEMPMNDANTLYSEPYSRLNLKVGVRRSMGSGWWFDVYGGMQNVTDNHYASMILINAPSYGGSAPRYYYPAEPRNYYGGISVRYAF
jgi:iron complex outermembrane receptor protein